MRQIFLIFIGYLLEEEHFPKFVFYSVSVDLKYNEIYLTLTAGHVCLCGVCSHVIILGMSVRLSRYPMWMR